MSKALEDFKLVELTLVVAIPTYYDAVSAIDYVMIHDEAQLLGSSEQLLTVAPVPDDCRVERTTLDGTTFLGDPQ